MTIVKLLMRSSVIIAFSLLVILVKLLFGTDLSRLAEQELVRTFGTALLFLFLLAGVLVMLFLLVAMFSKPMPTYWWEGEGKSIGRKEKWLEIYLKILAIAFPVVVYGLIIIAGLQSWRIIAMIGAAVMIGKLLDYFKGMKLAERRKV